MCVVSLHKPCVVLRQTICARACCCNLDDDPHRPQVRNLELRDIVPLPAAAPGAPLPVSKYDLVANVVHEGRAEGGAYKSHIHR